MEMVNVMAGTFGNSFTTGTSSGPVYVIVQGNVEAQIVVSTYGTWTEEIGFRITAPNGTEIYRRSSGSTFSSNTIFKSFCPIGGCPVYTNVTYQLTMTDWVGDGWEGTTLAFKQDGLIVSKFTLSTGSEAGPIACKFKKYSTVTIVVFVLGAYTQEVGFVLRNSAGVEVFRRNYGVTFYANTILGTFCPECLNLSPVNMVADTEAKTVDQKKTNESTTVIENTEPKAYMIATYVLASVVLLLWIALGCSIFKNFKQSKIIQEKNAPASENYVSSKNIVATVQAMNNE